MADTSITMYGTLWCGDCKRAKRFLGEQRIRYAYVDVEQDAAGLVMVERVNGGKQIVPTIVFGDGSVLVEPSNAELAAKLGLRTAAKSRFYDLIVVGGGNSAGEETVFLTRFASKVTIAVRGDRMTASQVVRESVENDPKIEVLTGVVVDEFRGDDRLRSVVLRDTRNGERREVSPAGVFVFVGLTPNTGFVRDLVETDGRGFVLTEAALQTSTPGIYAAGDCRAGSTKQATSAAGEGAAALAIRRYLEPLASGLPRRACRGLRTTDGKQRSLRCLT